MGKVADEESRIRELAKTNVDIDEGNSARNFLEKKEYSLTEFRELVRSNHTGHLYDRWKSHWIRQGNDWANAWGQADEQALEKLKGIHFGKLNGWRWGRLKHLIESVGCLYEGGKAAVAAFEPVWGGESGPAARESLQKFNSKSQFAAEQSWPKLLEHVDTMAHESSEVLRRLVEWGGTDSGVKGVYNQFYSHINSDSDEGHRGSMHELIDLLNEYQGDGDLPVGASPQQIADFFAAGLGEFVDSILGDTGEEQASGAQWLDHFCTRYSSAIELYREAVKDATEAIEKIQGTFTQNVNGLDMDLNPFADLPGAKKSVKKPKKSAGEPNDRGQGRSQGESTGTGGVSTGSGGVSTGSGTPSGTGGAAPTEPASGPATTPAGGTNPVTGQPLEVDPATGQPYPIDPTTGQPVKDIGDDQDTTTVKHGEKEISVTEPSKTGEMQVGVDDGKGGIKNYKLDFDPENNPKDGKEEGAGGGAGGYGPQGAGKEGAVGKGASAEGEVHKPGEDGKIRIKDGDLEIVAEQPLGPDGATVVTIDDGKGEPETMVLGDKEDVDEFNRRLAQDEEQLADTREQLESRGDDASKREWDELNKAEESFRERGGHLDIEDGDKGDPGKEADKESSAQKSAFDEATSDSKSPGIGKSAFDDDPKGASGVSGGGSGGGAGVAGAGGGGGGAGVGSSPQLEDGARSGVAGPTTGGGGVGAGVGAAPAADGAASGSGKAMGGGMMGAPMGAMGGGGGGGGGDEQRSSNAAYQVQDSGLFEPAVSEGPFGVARISGDLNEEDS